MTKPSRDSFLVQKYVAAVSSHLRTAKFGKGDPGDRMHILVIDQKLNGKGNIVGRGEALCGATYAHPILVRGTPGEGTVVCARCEKVLSRLASWIANSHSRDLFAQASESVAVTVAAGEVAAALAVPSIRADFEEVEYSQLDLPTELLPEGSGDFVGVSRAEVRRLQGEK